MVFLILSGVFHSRIGWASTNFGSSCKSKCFNKVQQTDNSKGVHQWDNVQWSAMSNKRTLSLWRKWKQHWFHQNLILVRDGQLSYFQRQRQWNEESYSIFVTRKMGNLHCCGSILIKWRFKQMQHNATCARKTKKWQLWFAWSIVVCFPIRSGMEYPVEGSVVIKITMGLQGVITRSLIFFITTRKHPLSNSKIK